MLPKWNRLFALALILPMFAAGAIRGQAQTTSEGIPQLRFEALHLWATEAEQRALAVFKRALAERDVIFEEQYVRTNFRGVRDTLSERMALGIPPTAVVWIGDEELRDFIKEGRMRAIPDEHAGKKFSDLLLPEVHQVVKMDDNITAIPIGIHSQNNAIYNLRHLEAVGRPIPQSWEEMIETAKLLKAAGYIPISTSTESWQMRPLILSIIADGMNADDFYQYFGNDSDLEMLEAKLTSVLKILAQLRELSNEDRKDLSWEASVMKVKNNLATANFLGDFNSPMIEANRDIVCAAPPGNKAVIWSFDAAAFPNGDETLAQDIFAELATHPEIHKAYIEAKGGVPVFSGLKSENYQRCTNNTLKRWEDSEFRLYLPGGVWSQQLNVITVNAKAFWESSDNDPKPYVETIVRSLEILLGKYDK